MIVFGHLGPIHSCLRGSSNFEIAKVLFIEYVWRSDLLCFRMVQHLSRIASGLRTIIASKSLSDDVRSPRVRTKLIFWDFEHTRMSACAGTAYVCLSFLSFWTRRCKATLNSVKLDKSIVLRGIDRSRTFTHACTVQLLHLNVKVLLSVRVISEYLFENICQWAGKVFFVSDDLIDNRY